MKNIKSYIKYNESEELFYGIKETIYVKFKDKLNELKLSLQEFEDSGVLKTYTLYGYTNSIIVELMFILPYSKNMDDMNTYIELLNDIKFRLEGLSFPITLNRFFPFSNDKEHQTSIKFTI